MASAPRSSVEPNCAICGAPPVPECPHEGQRLELALDQAVARWEDLQRIRNFVLDRARNQIMATFHSLRAMRLETHHNYLQSLPYYTLYHRFSGHPPLEPAQLQLVHSQIQRANHILQQGVDQDWRTSCQRYPQVLDYYFSLAEIVLPDDRDPRILDPRFGESSKHSQRRVKDRRDSVEVATKEHRKRDRRRSRGRTPPAPPRAPMPYR